jgi:hypothetical protein
MKKPKNLIKYVIGLVTVILLRLVPHPPNMEPVMATAMPFGKKWGWLGGLLFGLAAILAFDIITGTLGVWSIMTAGTYALIGAAAGLFFRKRESKISHYLAFSVIGTLVYDAITGIGTGMLFFHQTFLFTLIGQIPFTMYHLGGNVILAIVISPALYDWVLDNPKFETQAFLRKLKALLPS